MGTETVVSPFTTKAVREGSYQLTVQPMDSMEARKGTRVRPFSSMMGLPVLSVKETGTSLKESPI